MSSYVPYSEESKKVWVGYILNMLRLLYSNGDIMLLGQILNQVYELSLWCVVRTQKREFNVKDLYVYNNAVEFKAMCKVLVRIRNIAEHQPFNLPSNKPLIDQLLKDVYFKELLTYVFDDASVFDEMLTTYSRWLYE